MLCKYLLECHKFKFCFLEFSGILFSNIFNLWLVEYVDAEPMDTEGPLLYLVRGRKERCRVFSSTSFHLKMELKYSKVLVVLYLRLLWAQVLIN